jgi:hypothetical protein
MLKENVKKYLELSRQADELKAQLEELKASIVEEMESNNITKYEDGEVNANLIYKTNIKYNDELSMIKYCEENGLNQFVTKKLNTTSMNKELKKSKSLNESLNQFYTETTTKTLQVKGV